MNGWKAKPSPEGLRELYAGTESPAWVFAFDGAMGRATKRALELNRDGVPKAVVQVKPLSDGVEFRVVHCANPLELDEQLLIIIVEVVQTLSFDDFFERPERSERAHAG